MKVILREDLEGIGNIGEVLEVSRGFARNYLLPRNKAVEATTRNLKSVEHAKRVIADKARKEKAVIEDYAKQVSAITVTIPVRVGKDDKLYGSVTTKDIAEALQAQGVEVDKRKLLLDQPLRELGSSKVTIKLHSQVTADITVVVVKAEATEEALASPKEA
jgi:large subunit ribosomal protein L9